MGDTDSISWTTIIAYAWSILAIVVPLLLVHLGTLPVVMTGIAVGSAVRFGTDLLILLMMDEEGTAEGRMFKEGHMRYVSILVLLQIGTLLGAMGYYLITDSVLAGSIVIGIVMHYVVGTVLQYLSGNDQPENDVEEQSESEWRFDVEDFD